MTEKTIHFISEHQPCPCGESSDAFALNNDHSGYCFSCKKFFKEHELLELIENGNAKPAPEIEQEYIPDEEDQGNVEFKYREWRGIYKQSFEYFGSKTKLVNGLPVEIAFPYPNGALKIRKTAKKDFFTQGDFKSGGMLFGMDRFDPGAYEAITIVEGELDALSVFQMVGNKTAVVSIRSSVTAKKDCGDQKNWEFINSFPKIILCLDNDERGQSATDTISSLFDFNKVFKVDMTRHKDANDYLQASEMAEFIKAWYSAKRYTPDNLISTFHEIEESLKDSQEDMIGSYPFKGLQDALYGLRRGEVIVFKGPEGIGKTETFSAIEHHLLKENPDNKIAIIHLEEDEGTTVKGIATYEDKYPYVHPQFEADNQTILTAFKNAVDNREDKVYIYKSFDVEDENQLLDNIRFMVTSCGCQFVFLDHISWLATGLDGEDERRKLDRISQKMKLLAKELRFALCMISHVNDEGKTRGSRNITKVADTVINMTRDLVAPSMNERNKMSYMVEKARKGGNTGPGGYAMFDKETMRLVDSEEYKFELEGVSKRVTEKK